MPSKDSVIEIEAGKLFTQEVGRLINKPSDLTSFEEKIAMGSPVAEHVSLKKINDSYWLFVQYGQSAGDYTFYV